MIISQNPAKRHHKKLLYKQTLIYRILLWTNKWSYVLIKKRNKKKQNKKQKKKRVCNIYFWPACKVIKLKEEDVTLSTSLFMFHPIFLSPHFFVHVSLLFPSVHISLFMFHCYFLQFTLHCSCFIVISFSPQYIPFTYHISLIWLYSYYMVI